jgi:hypothetical protein
MAKDARPGAERAYLRELTARLRTLLGGELVGVYAGGSYALAGYEAGRSDLDVAAVVRSALRNGVADRIVAALRHEALPCPARKLELVVYREDAVSSPSVEPSFELNLNTGAHEPFRAETDPQPGDGHWFAIDRTILAGRGIALHGPAAGEVFAAASRADLLPLLADGLRWYRREEPDSEDGLLNAGRALCFAREGVWTTKQAMRSWAKAAIASGGTKEDVLRRAIAELERA